MLLHKSVEFDSRVRREASALAGAGHQVTVLELAEVPSSAAHLEGFDRRSVLPRAEIWRRLPRVFYRLAFVLGFLRAIVRQRPDIVHAHDAAMLVPGIVGARLSAAQLVYDSHELATSVPYRERGWATFVGLIERLVVPRCAAVITVSDGIAARLRDRYGLSTPPTVLRNVSALRPSGAGGLRTRLELPSSTPLVLHQGAPAAGRGCDVLVQAISLLPGTHLAFLGDPEPGYGNELEEVIVSTGTADRVRLLPSVPLRALIDLTAEADVGVSLLQDTCENHRLALPNKLFEYIAARIPVVTSALPEMETLVRAYDIGRCADPTDPQAVADAISEVLSMRDESSLGGRLARAAEELSWSRESVRLLDLYAALGHAPAG